MKVDEITKRMKLNYIALAGAVIDKAIADTKLKVTRSSYSTKAGNSYLKRSAKYFLNNFDNTIWAEVIAPYMTPEKREIMRKAAQYEKSDK